MNLTAENSNERGEQHKQASEAISRHKLLHELCHHQWSVPPVVKRIAYKMRFTSLMSFYLQALLVFEFFGILAKQRVVMNNGMGNKVWCTFSAEEHTGLLGRSEPGQPTYGNDFIEDAGSFTIPNRRFT